MGGPCRLKVTTERTPDGRIVHKLKQAPECTDNFQLAPFTFEGFEWHSCEQCYQALKFVSTKSRDRIRSIVPLPEESASAHGMRAWSEGQRLSDVRADWNAVKVEVMLRVNRAKYAQHPELQQALLSTGVAPIAGAPSTSWALRDGTTVNWSRWNGLIQTQIRAELAGEQGDERGAGAREEMRELIELFDHYMTSEGGQQTAIPGAAPEDASAPAHIVSGRAPQNGVSLSVVYCKSG